MPSKITGSHHLPHQKPKLPSGTNVFAEIAAFWACEFVDLLKRTYPITWTDELFKAKLRFKQQVSFNPFVEKEQPNDNAQIAPSKTISPVGNRRKRSPVPARRKRRP